MSIEMVGDNLNGLLLVLVHESGQLFLLLVASSDELFYEVLFLGEELLYLSRLRTHSI